MEASGALGKFGDGSSVVDLRAALAMEQDENAKRVIAKALKLLESK
jgi:hypothetical protein